MYRCKKCFDEISYYETYNDLWEAGICNDKFKLLSKLDENCNVVVKTPCGVTNEFDLKQLIMQGSVFGSLKCVIQTDTLGKEALAEGEGCSLYKYKNMVDIPPLSLVDDIMSVSNCSPQTMVINGSLNSKIESRKLRMGQDKCVKLHVGKTNDQNCKNKPKVHNELMKSESKTRYLGDIFSASNGINETVSDRHSRGIGIVTQLSSILKSISLGPF